MTKAGSSGKRVGKIKKLVFHIFERSKIKKMNTSLMSYALGIHGCEAQGTRYEGNRVIINIKTKEERINFAKLVIDLSRISTIKDVAQHLRVSWDTVKDIQKSYLKYHFSCPDISKTRHIGIDEFFRSYQQILNIRKILKETLLLRADYYSAILLFKSIRS